MAGGYPLLGDVCNGQMIGALSSNSLGTTVTASSIAGTKGSWIQLTAATATDSIMMEVTANLDGNVQGAGTVQGIVDIGIGGAGSEIVLVPNLVIGAIYLNNCQISLTLPMCIPSGTRIAARSLWAGAGTAENPTVVLGLYDGSYEVGEGAAGVDALGVTSSLAEGTAITPSVTANTKGSYAQITAATSHDYFGLFGLFDTQISGATVAAYLIDIAVGSAGNEQVILPNRPYYCGSAAGYNGSAVAHVPFLPIRVPSGTRLSARCQCGSSNGGAIGVSLYGVF